MVNVIRILFTHPAAREVFVEWSGVASASVYAMRPDSNS